MRVCVGAERQHWFFLPQSEGGTRGCSRVKHNGTLRYEKARSFLAAARATLTHLELFDRFFDVYATRAAWCGARWELCAERSATTAEREWDVLSAIGGIGGRHPARCVPSTDARRA